MDIEGMIILDLGETSGVSQRTGNPWKKHEWVLETNSQYPRKVKFDVFGDRCDTLTFELNKSYVVSVDADSREFNGRWYTDLRAFAARPVEGGVSQGPVQQGPVFTQASAPQAAPAPQNPFAGQQPDFSGGNSEEDLPF